MTSPAIRIAHMNIVLRPFDYNDYGSAFENWTSDRRTAQHLSWNPHKSCKDTENLIRQWIHEYVQTENYRWCIDFHGASIGCLEVKSRKKTHEISYCLGSKYWNQGIMTCALRECLNYLSQNNMTEFMALCLDANDKSKRVLEKNGFAVTATTQQNGNTCLVYTKSTVQN